MCAINIIITENPKYIKNEWELKSKVRNEIEKSETEKSFSFQWCISGLKPQQTDGKGWDLLTETTTQKSSSKIYHLSSMYSSISSRKPQNFPLFYLHHYKYIYCVCCAWQNNTYGSWKVEWKCLTIINCSKNVMKALNYLENYMAVSHTYKVEENW